MAEIKSTIDIVMERTRGLVQSDEEKAQARAEERAKKISGLLLGLREERISPDNLPRLLDESSGGDPEGFRAEMIRALIAGLAVEGSHGLVLDGLEVLAGGRLAEPIRDTRTLLDEYAALKADLSQQAAGDALAELAAVGITGSALQPRAQADADYPDRLGEVEGAYESRLSDLKRAMRESAFS